MECMIRTTLLVQGFRTLESFWIPFDGLKGRLDGTYHELIWGRTLFGVSPHAGRGERKIHKQAPLKKGSEKQNRSVSFVPMCMLVKHIFFRWQWRHLFEEWGLRQLCPSKQCNWSNKALTSSNLNKLSTGFQVCASVCVSVCPRRCVSICGLRVITTYI